MTLPDAFGAVLVESPSLWIAEERFLNELLVYIGAWPQVTNRSQQLQTYVPWDTFCVTSWTLLLSNSVVITDSAIVCPRHRHACAAASATTAIAEAVQHLHAWQRTYLAMGSKEYSGIRPAALAEPDFDARLAAYHPGAGQAPGLGAWLRPRAPAVGGAPPATPPPVLTNAGRIRRSLAGTVCAALQCRHRGGSAPAFPVSAGARTLKLTWVQDIHLNSNSPHVPMRQLHLPS